jgi:hypothetical protein
MHGLSNSNQPLKTRDIHAGHQQSIKAGGEEQHQWTAVMVINSPEAKIEKLKVGVVITSDRLHRVRIHFAKQNCKGLNCCMPGHLLEQGLVRFLNRGVSPSFDKMATENSSPVNQGMQRKSVHQRFE